MAEQYKIIHPVKYYRDHLNHNIRPDGRELNKFRPVAINVGPIKTADGSSIIKIGNTTIACGIRAELCKPKSDESDIGFFLPKIELLPICRKKYRPTAGNIAAIEVNKGGSSTGAGSGGGSSNSTVSGAISSNSSLTHNIENSEIYTSTLYDILMSSNCIDLKELCIVKEKLVWSLYCDVICIDDDGCIIDAALISIIIALKSLKLPKILYDAEINKIEIDDNIKYKLTISSYPISTTLMIFDDNLIITDPTREEEDLSTSIITIGICNSDVCYLMKPGGTPFNQEQIDLCIQQAISREKIILNLINDALKE